MAHSNPLLEHRDDEGAKIGMWIFIFTEILLFGGLFLVYAVFRNQYSEDFHTAAFELNAFVGTLNTVILLCSSATVAMSITAVLKKDRKTAMILLGITLVLALVFMVNKYFEWSHKIHEGIYPGSELMADLERGELLFFSLYYFMTGLHALHILIGMTILTVILFKVRNGSVNDDRIVLLENGGLYWHLVDLIWIFLFPLLYLIT